MITSGRVKIHLTPGCQKLHVIADNYQLLILTAPKAPARLAQWCAPRAPAGLGQCAEGARRAGLVIQLRERVEPWLDTLTPDPDTTPTPRHSDTNSVNRHSVRHSDTARLVPGWRVYAPKALAGAVLGQCAEGARRV